MNSGEPARFDARGDAVHDGTKTEDGRHVDGTNHCWVRPVRHGRLRGHIFELRRVVVER